MANQQDVPPKALAFLDIMVASLLNAMHIKFHQLTIHTKT